MTWICYRGIELSARIQTILLSLEIFTLALFAVVALVKVYANSPAHSIHVSASWFNPFDLSWGALVDGVLLGIFIYWGWDSGVAVNEESRDRNRGPGKAAVVSTLILLLIYVVVSAAAQAYHGTAFLANNSERRVERARQARVRLAARQAADHLRAHLGLGVDADDDPADRAHDAVDGEVGCDPGGVRPGPPALLHADLLDAADGRPVDPVDGGAARVQPEPERARRHDLGARLRGLLLLRIHRPGLRRVLPPRPVQERPQLHPRRADPGGRRGDDGLRRRSRPTATTTRPATTTPSRSSASRRRSSSASAA